MSVSGHKRIDLVVGYKVDTRCMRTQEIADLAGVNPQTLRYYERIGLLPEPPRTPGGYRDYADESLRVLRFVQRAKQLGFQLDEIQELLGYDAHRPDACQGVRALAKQRIADLDCRISDLVRMRDALSELARRCPENSHGCPVLDALDV